MYPQTWQPGKQEVSHRWGCWGTSLSNDVIVNVGHQSCLLSKVEWQTIYNHWKVLYTTVESEPEHLHIKGQSSCSSYSQQQHRDDEGEDRQRTSIEDIWWIHHCSSHSITEPQEQQKSLERNTAVIYMLFMRVCKPLTTNCVNKHLCCLTLYCEVSAACQQAPQAVLISTGYPERTWRAQVQSPVHNSHYMVLSTFHLIFKVESLHLYSRLETFFYAIGSIVTLYNMYNICMQTMCACLLPQTY